MGAFTVRLPRDHSFLAAYVIGSGSCSLAHMPRDFDLLLVDVSTDEAKHETQLQQLIQSMSSGDPFEAAFDATNSSVRSTIESVIRESASAVPSIDVRISFAFGPARGEIDIPDNALHIHIAGPLTKGDLRSVESLLPFHACDFLRHHKKLVGPCLSTLLSDKAPTIYDLVYWDQLLFLRFKRAYDQTQRHKWFVRMLRNRMVVPEYMKMHSALVDRCIAAAGTSSPEELGFLLDDLISSAQVLIAGDSQQFEV